MASTALPVDLSAAPSAAAALSVSAATVAAPREKPLDQMAPVAFASVTLNYQAITQFVEGKTAFNPVKVVDNGAVYELQKIFVTVDASGAFAGLAEANAPGAVELTQDLFGSFTDAQRDEILASGTIVTQDDFASLSLTERREVLMAFAGNLTQQQVQDLVKQGTTSYLSFLYVYGDAGAQGQRVLLSALQSVASQTATAATSPVDAILLNLLGNTRADLNFAITAPFTPMANQKTRFMKALNVAPFFAASTGGKSLFSTNGVGSLVKSAATSYSALPGVVKAQASTVSAVAERVGRIVGTGILALPILNKIPGANLLLAGASILARVTATVVTAAVTAAAFAAYDIAAVALSAVVKVGVAVAAISFIIAVVGIAIGLIGAAFGLALTAAVASPVLAVGAVVVAGAFDTVKLIVGRTLKVIANAIVNYSDTAKELREENSLLRDALRLSGNVTIEKAADSRSRRDRIEAGFRKAFNWSAAVINALGQLEARICKKARVFGLRPIAPAPKTEVKVSGTFTVVNPVMKPATASPAKVPVLSSSASVDE